MRQTRLIIVEGVMGSGKSTLSKAIVHRLREHRYPVKHVPESFREHPTNVTRTLTHWQKIWTEHTAETFIAQSLQNWQTFIANAHRTSHIYVFDGQVFHGDLTSLFIANTPSEQLSNYISQIFQLMAPLQPVFVYLYQADVAWGLQRTASIRGQRFLRRQAAWKVDSPYCSVHGYSGIPGLFRLYRDYRQLTDELYNRLPTPKLAIENSAGTWEQDTELVFRFLELPPATQA